MSCSANIQHSVQSYFLTVTYDVTHGLLDCFGAGTIRGEGTTTFVERGHNCRMTAGSACGCWLDQRSVGKSKAALRGRLVRRRAHAADSLFAIMENRH